MKAYSPDFPQVSFDLANFLADHFDNDYEEAKVLPGSPLFSSFRVHTVTVFRPMHCPQLRSKLHILTRFSSALDQSFPLEIFLSSTLYASLGVNSEVDSQLFFEQLGTGHSDGANRSNIVPAALWLTSLN